MKDVMTQEKRKKHIVYQEKTNTYLIGLTKNLEFLKAVEFIREYFKITPAPYEIVDGKVVENKAYIELEERLSDNNAFYGAIDILADAFGLAFLWGPVVMGYVLTGEFLVSPFQAEIMTTDLKKIFTKDHPDPYIRLQSGWADMMPLAIQFSAYTTQRDLINYIKQAYKEDIAPMQEQYRKQGIMIGKYRKRNERVTKRNKFIYENRSLSRAKLTSLVASKFGDILDYTYLNKIIADEKKRK